jgi:phosphohistidine swiveling domain-containing protein
MPTIGVRGHGSWRQINYRLTPTLLAAEFLHGLYQRHNPFINPVHFESTLVVFQPWMTTAYTPGLEWAIVIERLGQRFLLDTAGRCGALRETLRRPRLRTAELVRQLRTVAWADLSAEALVDLLLEMHHVPLGDIYEMNLVQLESALHEALVGLVVSHSDGASAARPDAIVAELCRSSSVSAMVAEETSFIEFVTANRERPVADLEPLMRDRLDGYRRLVAGYGDAGPSLDALKGRFTSLAALGEAGLRERLEGLRRDGREEPAVEIARTLESRDRDVAELAETLRLMGDVRDRNKLLLGSVTTHRRELLDEVARRSGVPGEELRLYLLEELCELLCDGLRVPHPVVERRRSEGLVFERRSHARPPQAADPWQSRSGTRQRNLCLRGIGASPGAYEGPAFVLERGAAVRGGMSLGGVLVAPGTDFDLGLLLNMAGAVVTEEGGILSHAALISRERGVPALIQVQGATEHLVTGDWVRVDGSAGTVVRRAPEPASGTSAAEPAPGEGHLLTGVGLARAAGAEIGGKASTLVRMLGAGYPVPSPLLVLPVGRVRDIETMAGDRRRVALAEAAREILAACDAPAFAVRSSAPLEDIDSSSSSAGMYESTVGVPRELAALGEAIDIVIRSAGAARVRLYHLSAADRGAAMAVLVMPSVACDVSGTAQYPSRWDRSRALVEIAGDRGDHVTVLVEASPGNSDRQAASELAVPGIVAELARRARTDLAAELVEIEWGYADGDVHLFQARPILGWAAAPPPEAD